ncbi:PEP-CTERM sorting domain-containing protein [Luteolibacter sp. SL250]|nr:PEP-CTERM sorting domain-containing protein [Luteolibacter sp. SL250]WAC21446.1 PEP-CTERM sorting domain-containing protein [Luteolibacter sp. SL250]
MKVPIEVLKEGQSPRVIYVELDTPAIPEPSTMLLLPFSAALMFRRKR